jgi:predicted CoA-binding protein
MVTKHAVDDFLAQKTLAIVGVSRSGKKFGNSVLKELSAKGYRVIPVHPAATHLEGVTACPSLTALPQKPGGLIVVVRPSEAARVVRDAAAAGITRVWLQQGSDSPEAIRFCTDHGISVVHGHCILMFAEPAAFFHRAHRFVRGLMGRLPAS